MSKPLTDFEAKVLKQLKHKIQKEDEQFNTLSRIETLDRAASVAGVATWPISCALEAKPGTVYKALIRLCGHGLVVRTPSEGKGIVVRWFPVSLYPDKGTFAATGKNKNKLEVKSNV
ncbi:TPA: hypothetical protein ACVU5P_004224 [Vibrio parahaemolyticus]